MSQFSTAVPNVNNAMRDTYNFDRAYGTQPRVNAATVAPASSVRTLPASPALEPPPSAEMTPDRALGLRNDLQNQANRYSNAAFADHWGQQTRGIDVNDPAAVEKFAQKYGVKRGTVSISGGPAGKDMSGGAMGPGIRQTGESHTMTNEELLAAAKSRAREQFSQNLQAGYQPRQLPPSPALPALASMPGAIGPTQAGSALGATPTSPALPAPPGMSPEVLAGYQATLAGNTPNTTNLIAGRLGMQPYDVQQQQIANVTGQNLAAGIPAQQNAQNALTLANASQMGGQTALMNAQANTLIPAQAQAAAGQGSLATAQGNLANAQATGAISPDEFRKREDKWRQDLATAQAKHQQELQAMNLKLAAAQEQLRQARGGKVSEEGGGSMADAIPAEEQQYMGGAGGAGAAATAPAGTPAATPQNTTPAMAGGGGETKTFEGIPGWRPTPGKPNHYTSPDGRREIDNTPWKPGSRIFGSTVLNVGTRKDGSTVYHLADGRVVDEQGRALS